MMCLLFTEIVRVAWHLSAKWQHIVYPVLCKMVTRKKH